MRYARVYADAEGETHCAEVDVAFAPVEFAPPAPPVELSAFMPSTRVAFLRTAAGSYREPHTAPARQLLFTIAGEWTLSTSDGDARHFAPGSVVLVEDTTGKGHAVQVGNSKRLMAVVQLPT